MANWWDVCAHGICTPWAPPPSGSSGNASAASQWGVSGYRSDYSVPLPQGTPIVAPVSGIVMPQHTTGGGYYSAYGQQSFGGEVDILSDVSLYKGLVVVGVIHMDTATVSPGDQIKKGQIIGTSGGQTQGGHWPSSPNSSSGPHVGLQVHLPASWDQLLDPGILMDSLLAGQDTSQAPTPAQMAGINLKIAVTDRTAQDTSSGQVGSLVDAITAFAERHVNHTINDDFYSVAIAIDDAETFPPLSLLTQPDNLGPVGAIPIVGGALTGLATIKDTPTRIVAFLWASAEAVAIRGFFFLAGAFILLLVIARILNEQSGTIEGIGRTVAGLPAAQAAETAV